MLDSSMISLTNPTSLLHIATNEFASFCIESRLHHCFFCFVDADNVPYSVMLKDFSLLYKTNEFHVMHLFSNRSLKTSKCGKNISDPLGYRLVCNYFDFICDPL